VTSRRGTSNTAIRGNAAQRRASKRALLARDGDGEKAPCWECGTLVTFETMIRDKIKAGRDGGRYVLSNLRVHCQSCSQLQGHRMGLETRRWRAWKKAGLRRSRFAPDGQLTPHWNVYLGDAWVGYVTMTACGTWMCASPRLACPRAGHQTMRVALYALLVECTTNTERKAAA